MVVDVLGHGPFHHVDQDKLFLSPKVTPQLLLGHMEVTFMFANSANLYSTACHVSFCMSKLLYQSCMIRFIVFQSIFDTTCFHHCKYPTRP